ncbi:MAG: DUF5317 domain-containing protein [Clostridium sp.]|nr:DUF5317 domain-containing protein [Clostridium sp.]
MLFFIAILLAFTLATLYGIITGKKFTLLNTRLKGVWLVGAAFVFQTGTRFLGMLGINLVVKYTLAIQAVVFGLVFMCFWLNRRYIGLWIVGVGASLNALVMLLNGGRMPVSFRAMQRAGIDKIGNMILDGADNKHIIINKSTKLTFLADVIYLPGFLGEGIRVMSAGDVLVAFGLFIFVFELCSSSMEPAKRI